MNTPSALLLTVFVSLLFHGVEPSQYLGCFIDYDERILIGAYTYYYRYMTAELCMDFCAKSGFRYAGMEIGVECFCSNVRPSATSKAIEADCSMTCAGNDKQLCGGNWRLSVHDVTGQDVVPTNYLGCFIDNAQRLLPEQYNIFSTYLTPEVCMEFCAKKGYRYAGVEVGTECFCSNTRPSASVQTREGECNMTCAGNSKKSCGGPWRINVYDGIGYVVTNTSPGQDAKRRSYLGCYIDNAQRIFAEAITFYFTYLTPELCMDFCDMRGLRYAGMEVGAECYCSNTRPSTTSKAIEADCSVKCVGDTQRSCGGDWRLSVYDATGLHVKPANYLGCFIDSAQRLLAGVKDLQTSMVRERCMEFCAKNRYRYAGMEVGEECFCSNTRPSASLQAKEGDCNMPCKGNTKQLCGGPWRLSVFDVTGQDIFPTNYLGCFIDNAQRILAGASSFFRTTLTAEVCMDFCRRSGFRYAGMEASEECYCSNTRPSASLQAMEGDCNMPCSGDAKQPCGGPWRINVYDATGGTTTSPPTSTTTIPPTSTTTIPPTSTTTIPPTSTTSVLPITKTSVHPGKKTSVHPGKKTSVHPGRKTSARPGSTSSILPGKKTTVHPGRKTSVHPGEQVKPKNYVGCFSDTPFRILRGLKRKFPSTLTVEVCLEFCQRRGFRYAGVEWKVDCYCSNKAPSTSLQAKERKCNTPCAGNGKQNCGGSWHISVYKSKDYYLKNYLGCYTDRPKRILRGRKTDFPNTLTVEVCLSHCKRNGFRFAGVESKIECHCSNALPRIKQLSSEDNCDEPCEGNPKQTCGGSWHLNLFDTKGLRLTKYLGCYVDKGKTLLPEQKTVFRKTLTVEVCQDHCLSEGFKFSGVEGRVECYCSNRRPGVKQLANEASCNLPCVGNKKQNCGGSQRVNVYEALTLF